MERMKKVTRRSVISTHLLAGTVLCLAISAGPDTTREFPAEPSVTFEVNFTSDGADANLLDGVCDANAGAHGNQCTLRAAVEQANALSGNDTISIPAGTYYVGSTILVTSTIVIQGAGQSQTIITSGTDGDTVFKITLSSGSNLTVNDVAFSSCHRAFWNQKYLTINNSLFEFCHGGPTDVLNGHGAAVYNEPSGVLNVTGSTFDSNHYSGEGFGGALYNAGKADVKLSAFTNNHGYKGGAIYLATTFQDTLVEYTKLQNNQATFDGGGIYADGSVTAEARKIWLSHLEGNSAQKGGGIFLATGEISILQSSATANQARLGGGGVYSESLATTIYATNSTFSGNTSDTHGGAFFITGAAYLSNVTVVLNTADHDSSGNDGNGGGIFADTGSGPHLKNSILADNTDASSGTFGIKSHDCAGTLTADGNVLVGVANNATLCTVGGSLEGSRIGTSGSRINPGLDSLTWGPLGYTKVHPLLAGSPAVDAGNLTGCKDFLSAALTEDQRREIRPLGLACDIGSYESVFTPSLPGISIGNVTQAEGNAGSVNAVFTVTLSAPVNWVVSVTAQTSNGTALDGSDYTGKSEILKFQPGESGKTFSVAVLGDTLPEGSETFVVTLSSAHQATITTPNATGTITDDDTRKAYLPLATK